MKPLSRPFHLFFLLCLLLPASGLLAQWSVVAPHLLRTTSLDWKGAMCFRDGIIWLARDVLYRSADSGITWNRVLDLSTLKSGNVEDIDFFDRTTGVIVDSGGSFITKDGGATWKRIRSTEAAHSACFGNSAAAIAVGSAVSTDGGANWYSGPITNTWVQCVRPDHDGSFVFFGGSGFFANFFQTTNGGVTWSTSTSTADEDSWSFAIDSCDGRRIYMSNENVARPTDDFSKLLVTSNFGSSWTTTASFPRDFFAGSIAESRRVLYCPTVKQGVFRSIDRGITWASIGGPNASPDTRLIAAITDNIVVVVDTGGTLWRTANSGGSPLNLPPNNAITIAPNTLFTTDTVRCDSLVRSIAITRMGCAPPDISGWSLLGSDASSYHTERVAADSIRVGLVPTRSGILTAKLVIALTDGSMDTVQLGGFNAGQIGTISPTARTLFDHDTARCDTLTRFVHFKRAGCFPPRIDSISFSGQDAAAYLQGSSSPDSLGIVFLPSSSGKKSAQAVFHKSDGERDTVVLNAVSIGYGKLTPASTLFVGDTVHCDKLVRTLLFHPTGCAPPAISSTTLHDGDTGSYLIGSASEDSVSITFSPSRGGNHHANLVLSLADGSSDTVSLNGFNDVGYSSISTTALFGSDTLQCDTITRGIKLHTSGCAPPTLAAWSCRGADSEHYAFARYGNDSIGVTLIPNFTGQSHAGLILALSDGGHDTIDLRGYASAVPFKYTLDAQSVFDRDSLYPCEGGHMATISANFKACHWPHILSQSIVGGAGSDYAILHHLSDPLLPRDSLVISFSPIGTGIRSATCVITFDDGTRIAIPLGGYGIAAHQLAIATSDESPSTLGDVAQVPITLSGLARREDVELTVHYDPYLPYRGSFSASNTPLDIPGQQWKGRSKLRIAAATPNVLCGYASFAVYNDSLQTQTVSFDSLVVVSEIGPCQYLDAPPTSSAILLPEACGITFLSRFVHYGGKPAFSINPNPTSGTVNLISPEELGPVTLTIFDLLGIERTRLTFVMHAGVSTAFSMPVEDGLFYVRMETASGATGKTVLVRR